MDGAPPWQEDPPAAAGRRRWHLLLVVATVPWLMVAILLARGGSSTDANPATAPVPEAAGAAPHGGDPLGGGAGASAEATDHREAPDDPAPDGVTPPTVPIPPGAPSDGAAPRTAVHGDDGPEAPHVTDGDAATVATAVARAWLAEEGAPDLDGPEVTATDAGYLEHVTVRRIEILGPDLAVVTLGVLLLERDEGRYARVRAADLLVPLRLSGEHAHPAGEPWWSPNEIDLRPRPPTADEPTSEAVRTEVVTALAEAGYLDVQVTDVRGGADGLLVATVTAETSEGRRIDTDVWLRETPQGPHVLGTQP